MCQDCSKPKKCPRCAYPAAFEHDYKDGRRFQCCGDAVKLSRPEPKTVRPVRSKKNV